MPAHHVTAWLILPMRATARPEARGRIPGGFMPTAFEVMVGVKSDGAVGAQGGGGGGGRDSLADRALAACIVHVIKAAPTRVDYLRPILGNHVHSEAITISSAAPQIGRRAISFTPWPSPSAHLKSADAQSHSFRGHHHQRTSNRPTRLLPSQAPLCTEPLQS